MASGGKAVECETSGPCVASFRFSGAAGWYELNVQYFDQNDGASTFKVFVGNQLVDQWIADDNLPNSKISGDTSTRRQIGLLALRPGDEIRIEGTPDGQERAAFDYVAIDPSRE